RRVARRRRRDDAARRLPPLLRRPERGAVRHGGRADDRSGLYRRGAAHHRMEGKPFMSLRVGIGRVFSALRSTLGLMTGALVAAALLVWFTGPQLGWNGVHPLDAASVRLAIILVLVVIWALAS